MPTITLGVRRQFAPRRLRDARLHAGLTRENLAARVGRTERAVAGYESGAYTPTVAVLAALADTLRVPIDALFTTGGDSPPDR